MNNKIYNMLIASSNQVEPLEFVRTLGKGGFGTVNLVRSLKTGIEYALKIQHFNDKKIISSNERNFILNEVLNLKKIEMVHGFKFSTDGVQILMPLIKGHTPSADELYNNNPSSNTIKKYCFKALQKLHNRGLAHLDVHAGNFMLKDSGGATAIDMGFAHEANIFTIIYDYICFMNKFLNNSSKKLFEIIIESHIDHLKNNKLKTLIYSALWIISMYSLTAYVTARKLFGMLTKFSLENQGINLYYTLMHYKRIYLILEERRNSKSLLTNFIAKSNRFCAGLEFVFSAYLIKKIYNCDESVQNVKNKINHALHGELTYAEIDSQLLIDTVKITLMLAYDITNLYYIINEFIEAHIKPVESKLAACEAIVYAPKNMLNYFGVYAHRFTNIIEYAAALTEPSAFLTNQRIKIFAP